MKTLDEVRKQLSVVSLNSVVTPSSALWNEASLTKTSEKLVRKPA